MTRIKTICSWCGILIHDGQTIDGRVSHGCCKKCKAAVLTEIERTVPHDAHDPA